MVDIRADGLKFVYDVYYNAYGISVNRFKHGGVTFVPYYGNYKERSKYFNLLTDAGERDW